MEELVLVLNKLYKGSEFVYKTKYGGVVRGVVESVSVTHEFILDGDSEKKLTFFVDRSPKGTKTMEPPNLNGTEFYMALRPEIHIESTNGVMYDFKECFFINKPKNKELWQLD
jgi:hypothetical protein